MPRFAEQGQTLVRTASSGTSTAPRLRRRRGARMVPPLKPPSGPVRPRSMVRNAMPRGGRLLTKARWISASCSRCAASIVALVSTLSVVTMVPSTSETTSLITHDGFQCRPSRDSSAIAASGPSVPGGVSVDFVPALGHCVQDRLDTLPAGLDIVGAIEQRRVADQHVVDQRLVAGGRLQLEEVARS